MMWQPMVLLLVSGQRSQIRPQGQHLELLMQHAVRRNQNNGWLTVNRNTCLLSETFHILDVHRTCLVERELALIGFGHAVTYDALDKKRHL